MKPRRNWRITPGTKRDIQAILSMIRGLAHYEHLERNLKVSRARLLRDGFGQSPYFQTLLCRCASGKNAEASSGPVIGFALYFFTYSTFLASPTLYVEDVFVLPEHRSKGAGRALLSAVARIALRKKCGRMEWAVLDWNKPAIRFYRRMGASLRKEWILTRLTGTSLRRLARAAAR